MFSPENAVLLVIDVQGKLARLMYKREELLRNTARLIRAARYLEIPAIATEQVPGQIGKTVPQILRLLEESRPLAKASFSCCGEDQFMRGIEALGRRQVIVAGIEAHICVYQTVCDLMEKRYEVQVVGDAVSARAQTDKQAALDRIRSVGGGVTSTEMIICELLKTSAHPKFKEVINLIK